MVTTRTPIRLLPDAVSRPPGEKSNAYSCRPTYSWTMDDGSGSSPDEQGAWPSRRYFRLAAGASLVIAAIFAGWQLGLNRESSLGSRVTIMPRSNGEVVFLGGSGAGDIFGVSSVYVADPDGTDASRVSPSGNLVAVSWSPDGDRIAYIDSAGEFGGGSIYLMNADGSDRQVFVDASSTRVPLGGVGWSPDGRWIVYGAGTGMLPSGDNRYRIFVKSADGGAAIQLTQGPEEDLLPAFSPDGTEIAFSRLTQTPFSSSIDIMQADGSDVRTIVRSTQADLSGPSWSPEGGWIAFSQGRLIRLVKPDGSDNHVIYTCRPSCSTGGPTWSPDGRLIALTVPDGSRGRILTISPDGTGVRDLGSFHLQDVCCFAWQPVTP